jgi:hypothetical protein
LGAARRIGRPEAVLQILFQLIVRHFGAAERALTVSACLSVGAGSNFSAMALFSTADKASDTLRRLQVTNSASVPSDLHATARGS